MKHRSIRIALLLSLIAWKPCVADTNEASTQYSYKGRPVLIALKSGLSICDLTEPVIVQVQYDSNLKPTYRITRSSVGVYPSARVASKPDWEIVIPLARKNEWTVETVKVSPSNLKLPVNNKYSQAVFVALTYLDNLGELRLPALIVTSSTKSGYSVYVSDIPLTVSRTTALDVSKDFRSVTRGKSL
jgi:hypothetical protein